MPIRRAADPITVQHVWDAIRLTIYQHQMADVKRIVKYLQRVDKCTFSQAELFIQQSVQDGLIVALQKFTGKGEEVESFKIPNQNLPELDGKDWYCFECHLGGNVRDCNKCFRVFHSDCILNSRRKFEIFKKANSSIIIDHHSTTKDNNLSNISSISDDLNNSSNNTLNEEETSSRTSFNNNEINSSENNDEIKYIYNENLCSICNISIINHDFNLDKSEMNYLLKFVLRRIQSWLPNTITHTMAEEDRPEWLTDAELTWRANQLFFEHRDMSVIEVNLNNEFYTHIHEFLADVLTIQHNVAIFHGIESQEYGAADLMLRDCLHDLGELKNCVDCYRHSNEKINSKWFCLPCRAPHKLVWAKQKGYPYWPAKVIKETDTHFDVRFFGGKYERSLLGKSCIKSITVTKETLQIKSSSAFNKAVEELKFHQQLLTDPDQLKKLIESSKLKRTTTKHNKNSFNNKNSQLNNEDSSSILSNGNNSNNKSDVLNTTTSEIQNESFSNNVQQTQQKNKKRKLNNSFGDPVVNKKRTEEKCGNNISTENVINISDGEDERDEYSFKENCSTTNIDCDSAYEQVSSSTENYRNQDLNNTNPDGGMQQLDHPYSDSVEKMRRKIEYLTDKKEIIKCAMDCMQSEIDRITNDHNDHLKRLFESHNAQISETKKKQWCYNCEQDAIYHCCWNTAYCSQNCQQEHWQAEHKKVCRRKR